MYQLRRDILKKNCAAHGIRSLSAPTNWQPGMPSKTEMSTDINEFYLFHGTSSKSTYFICEHGFDERVAALSGLYGAGNYFVINSCNSHQYSSQNKDSSTFMMLVCRVAMGSPYCTSTSHNNQRRPPDNAATPGRPFDSIFAQHGIGRGRQTDSSTMSTWFLIAIRSTLNKLCDIQCKGAAGQVSRVEALHFGELEALDLTLELSTIFCVVHLQKIPHELGHTRTAIHVGRVTMLSINVIY
jgi:hypothetical protein